MCTRFASVRCEVFWCCFILQSGLCFCIKVLWCAMVLNLVMLSYIQMGRCHLHAERQMGWGGGRVEGVDGGGASGSLYESGQPNKRFILNDNYGWGGRGASNQGVGRGHPLVFARQSEE